MECGNRLEAVLSAECDGRLGNLAADAETIRRAVIGAYEAAVTKLPFVEPYLDEEGGVIMRLHKRYERDPKFVRAKRKAAAVELLACEVFGLDLVKIYGELGASFIEVHHTNPVHARTPGTTTKLADLSLPCANCHRVAYRRWAPLSIDGILALKRRRLRIAPIYIAS